DRPAGVRGLGRAAGARARRWPAAAAPTARRRADRAAQAGVRVRPAVLVLRDPELSRVVRVATAGRGGGGGAVARRVWCPGARARERELDVVRQGPRSATRARGAAAAARGRRRRRARAGVVPAACRDATLAR